MLVIAFGEVEAFQRAAGLMARIGCGKHGLAELNQMAHLPDGGDLLIECRGVGMRMQRFGTRRKLVVQRMQRLFDAALVATHCDGPFHDGAQIGQQPVGIVLGGFVILRQLYQQIPDLR